jgi:hypothetical protein
LSPLGNAYPLIVRWSKGLEFTSEFNSILLQLKAMPDLRLVVQGALLKSSRPVARKMQTFVRHPTSGMLIESTGDVSGIQS